MISSSASVQTIEVSPRPSHHHARCLPTVLRILQFIPALAFACIALVFDTPLCTCILFLYSPLLLLQFLHRLHITFMQPLWNQRRWIAFALSLPLFALAIIAMVLPLAVLLLCICILLCAVLSPLNAASVFLNNGDNHLIHSDHREEERDNRRNDGTFDAYVMTLLFIICHIPSQVESMVLSRWNLDRIGRRRIGPFSYLLACGSINMDDLYIQRVKRTLLPAIDIRRARLRSAAHEERRARRLALFTAQLPTDPVPFPDDSSVQLHIESSSNATNSKHGGKETVRSIGTETSVKSSLQASKTKDGEVQHDELYQDPNAASSPSILTILSDAIRPVLIRTTTPLTMTSASATSSDPPSAASASPAQPILRRIEPIVEALVQQQSNIASGSLLPLLQSSQQNSQGSVDASSSAAPDTTELINHARNVSKPLLLLMEQAYQNHSRHASLKQLQATEREAILSPLSPASSTRTLDSVLSTSGGGMHESSIELSSSVDVDMTEAERAAMDDESTKPVPRSRFLSRARRASEHFLEQIENVVGTAEQQQPLSNDGQPTTANESQTGDEGSLNTNTANSPAALLRKARRTSGQFFQSLQQAFAVAKSNESVMQQQQQSSSTEQSEAVQKECIANVTPPPTVRFDEFSIEAHASTLLRSTSSNHSRRNTRSFQTPAALKDMAVAALGPLAAAVQEPLALAAAKVAEGDAQTTLTELVAATATVTMNSSPSASSSPVKQIPRVLSGDWMTSGASSLIGLFVVAFQAASVAKHQGFSNLVAMAGRHVTQGHARSAPVAPSPVTPAPDLNEYDASMVTVYSCPVDTDELPAWSVRIHVES